MSSLGYISAFDGATVVDGSTSKHRSMVAESDQTILRIVTLPNGTKVNYDGTSDCDMVPGIARQRVVASGSSAITQLNALLAKKGNYGTASLTDQVSGTSTCSAILIDVNVLSNSVPAKKFYEYECVFELITNWA